MGSADILTKEIDSWRGFEYALRKENRLLNAPRRNMQILNKIEFGRQLLSILLLQLQSLTM
jgi:hypothetical protein